MYGKIGIRPTIDGRWGGVRESLEAQCRAMAESAKRLIESELFYPDGSPVQCVLSPCTIGGGAEAARCEEYFSTQNVCATLTVTPCWCYGTETMDLNPLTIKAVWGFNGTERRGAVCLAAVRAASGQRGLPAFSIYGHEVQEKDDREIPEDVREKILRFARAAVAVGSMRNQSYVNLGSVSMGIAGSVVNVDFLQKYLGMRTEWVDMTEILRRIQLSIYDPEEYEKAIAWVRKNCREGFDCNAGKDFPEIIQRSRFIPEEEQWSFCVKHALVVRDILKGNPRLKELGWEEEALGRNGLAGGFQGQRMWTDWLPNADFTEAIMASSLDWNGPKQPIPFATENDTLNGIAMMFGWLLAYLKVPTLITRALLTVSDNKIVILLLINIMCLVLGCIMDMGPLILILTPILLPVCQSFGMDPVHFGSMLILNLAIGLCTPPVGAALFVGCSIGKIKIEQVSEILY